MDSGSAGIEVLKTSEGIRELDTSSSIYAALGISIHLFFFSGRSLFVRSISDIEDDSGKIMY
jgi:hypothetical protein